MSDTLTTSKNRRIAYHKTEGSGPGVVFLGGFKSDMEGTKAVHLEDWAKEHGRAFLRFDYSGHGESSEAFTDGCIGDWADDAVETILTLTEGPQILVGSSMGGWISLLVAKRHPEKLAGLVGIAAAPDFTEDGYWAGFSDAQKAEVMETGQIAMPSDYGEPYILTRRLFEDGRNQLVLRDPFPIHVPVRLMQGTEDDAVERSVALALLDHLDGADIQLTFVKHVDHRFSDEACLAMIVGAVEEVSALA